MVTVVIVPMGLDDCRLAQKFKMCTQVLLYGIAHGPHNYESGGSESYSSQDGLISPPIPQYQVPAHIDVVAKLQDKRLLD